MCSMQLTSTRVSLPLTRTTRCQRPRRSGLTQVPQASAFNNSNGSGFAKMDEAPQGSLFTPQFMAVLQDSLQRQGDESLWEGPPAEERNAAEVEMMEFAVAHCIDRLQMLERMHKTVEAALAAETRQLQRLKFVQDKVIGSAAYTKTLKKMLDDAEREGMDRYRSATGSMLESWDSSSEDNEGSFSQYAQHTHEPSSYSSPQSSGGQWWESSSTQTDDSGSYDWQQNNWQQQGSGSPSPPQSSSNGSGGGAYASRRGGGDGGRRRGEGGRRR